MSTGNSHRETREIQPDAAVRDARPDGRRRRGRSAGRGSFQEDMVGSGPPLDSDLWRRVHPITPVLNIWQVLAAVVGVLIFNVAQSFSDVEGVTEFLMAHLLAVLGALLGVLLLIALVTGVYSRMAWRRMRYAVDDRAVYLQQGILAKEQRMARLHRVQAVDVNRPLLARFVGLAKLTIETAGGGDSKVEIKFLKVEEAERVRAEVLARAAGVDFVPGESPERAVRRAAAQEDPAADEFAHLAAASAGGDAAEGSEPGAAGSAQGAAGSAQRLVAPVAPERVVYEVAPGRLLLSVLLDVGVVLAVVVVVAGVATVLAFGIPIGSVIAMVPAVIAAVGYVWARVAGEWKHTSAVSPDGIRMRRGLTEKKSQTLPPGRVQAVELRQGLLWRWTGWWRVRVNVAGYGDEEGTSEGSQNVLLPVGTRGEALTALWLVVRDLGVDEERATIDAALAGAGQDAGFLVSPRRARLLDPLSWRHNGLLITRTVMITRRGRFTRTVVVVPHERTQSLAIEQGPWERRRGLADFVSHSVPGPVDARVPHMDAALAAEVLRQQAARARQARAKEGPEEWQRRMGVAAQARPGAAGDTDEGMGR